VRKLCPYVDLPLQHLNDAILKRIGRKVSQAQIMSLIASLRPRIAGVALRTAFIVGFPGETRAQFNEMLRLIEETRFDQVGAFKYSREGGTRAARMRGQVSDRAASRRLRDLMLTQQRIAFAGNAALAGHIVEVAVESPASEESGVWVSRTAFQAPDVDSVTLVHAERLKPGRFLRVRITGHNGYDLTAAPASASRQYQDGPQ